MDKVMSKALYEKLTIDKNGVVKFIIKISAKYVADIIKLYTFIGLNSTLDAKLGEDKLYLGKGYTVNSISTDRDGDNKVTLLNNDDDANLENVIKLVNKEFQFKIEVE